LVDGVTINYAKFKGVFGGDKIKTNSMFHLLQIDPSGFEPTFSPVLIYSLAGAAITLLIGVIIYYFIQRSRASPGKIVVVEKKSQPKVVVPEKPAIKSQQVSEKLLKETIPAKPPVKLPVKEAIQPVITPPKPTAPPPAPRLIIQEPLKPAPKKEEVVKPPVQPIIEPPVKISVAVPLKEVSAEPEVQSSAKFIGYSPVNIFEQSEPMNYPLVIMPKPNCVIKFPRKGRVGRKGYKEAQFLEFIKTHFKNEFQIHNDRLILGKADHPYEPDICLINEKNNLNLFIDVEIDEPYEGINDISKRKPTHYQGSDSARNLALKSRGWLTLRFAEIQVHKNPLSCCLFIADVIKSIHPGFIISPGLSKTSIITPLPQWTKEQAERWSIEKYREKYLGISSFGSVPETEKLVGLKETLLGITIESQVKEEIAPYITPIQKTINEKISLCIERNQFFSFEYEGKPVLMKPERLVSSVVSGFCYIKNSTRDFRISNISKPVIKDKAFVVEAKGPVIGIERIRDIVNTGIKYKKFIRIRYTKRAWSHRDFDPETGEMYFVKITESEVSVRTISNVQMSAEALREDEEIPYWVNDNYITAYCNLRDEQRTFKFDRISEIALLNI
jgi:hypothetical protein